MCGNVNGPRDQLSSARDTTSGACPSGPPMRKTRSRPRPRQCSRRCANCSDVHARPGTSSATTCAPLGNAESTRAPSSDFARTVSRPLPRWPGSISTSSSGSQCDSRLRYSAKPSATHAGARSPTAINRAFIRACYPRLHIRPEMRKYRLREGTPRARACKTGPSAAWMPQQSLQGCIHGVTRLAGHGLAASPARSQAFQVAVSQEAAAVSPYSSMEPGGWSPTVHRRSSA